MTSTASQLGKTERTSVRRKWVASACSIRQRMDRDVESAPTVYLNRPPRRALAIWRSQGGNVSRHRTTGRAVDRMLLALRAYEQRAQRRAALRVWMIQRRTEATEPRGRIVAPDAARG